MRILIAGLGAIGQRHARNLRALLGRDLELLAYRRRRLPHVVTDRLQRDDSLDVERELEAKVFLDFDAALAARPDAVFVCTPSSQHLELAQRAAEAGSHLFIEKPVSDTFEGVERLRQTVARAGLVAAVGCQWRWHPAVRALKQLVDQRGRDGVSHVEIDYTEYLPDWHPYEDYRASFAARADLGGGVVLTQIHDYDLAWWLFGPFSTVTASGGHLSHLEIDVEDTADARLDGGRVPVRIRQTFAGRPPQRVIRVHRADGLVTVDLLAGDYPRNNMFVDVARNFLRAIRGEEPPSTPLADGIDVLKVALAVKASMRTGRSVEIV